MLNYVFYDTTLQESFLNKISPVTKKITPLILDIEVGLKFTVNRLNFGYIYIYNTKKLKGLRYNYDDQHGRIIRNYLLH
jgi:lipid A 3-O-deacylase